jgi:hypothetical protein
MIAIRPVEHLIEAVLGGDGPMAVRLFDLIFDPLRLPDVREIIARRRLQPQKQTSALVRLDVESPAEKRRPSQRRLGNTVIRRRPTKHVTCGDRSCRATHRPRAE